MRIDVDINITPRTKRAIAWFLLPLVVLVGTVAVAHAVGMNPIDTSWIPMAAQNHAGISATRLQMNLDDLQAQISGGRFVATIGGQSYSVGGTFFKAATAVASAGNLGGYGGAKAACQLLVSGSASAHMCTADELVRSAQAGLPTATGWVSTGVASVDATGNAAVGWDCGGWTNPDGQYFGAVWFGDVGSNHPGLDRCNNTTAYRILCCD